MNKLLYGVAYYDEYMPYERLQQDILMMKKADINLVRIAESTWSTLEPEDGVFNFYHIDRVLEAMEKAQIYVIIGTPTYAIPSWIEKKHPDIMVETKQGQHIYGARQIMDITNEHYLFYCERVIRTLMKHIKGKECIIGFQIDNETKHYGTSCKRVQKGFVNYLKNKFNGDIESLNQEFGLNYWSNALYNWGDFPDIRGTINGSLGAEFEKFQRSLVTDFLLWQSKIVAEYKTENQFITHNFDFGWKDGSYGIQSDVNHFDVSKCLDIAGCDIYHPTQDLLTGAEIAFGGDLTRSLKQKNYYVLETQAQGFPEWLPYDNQLYLQAFSHFASGADCVEYWHWHSIHNSFETYWRGLLSHDFAENKTYRETITIGRKIKEIGPHLVHLQKNNKIAIMISNNSLTGLKWFPNMKDIEYNDVLRWIYDSLYEMNYECDFVSDEEQDLDKYDALILPAMYCISESALKQIKEFTEMGGLLIGTFKTAYTNENLKVYSDCQPHILAECFGIEYNQFTYPINTYLEGVYCNADDSQKVKGFLECLQLRGAKSILNYVHKNWKQYAAVTKNKFGNGFAYYLGCMFDKELLKKILAEAFNTKQIKPNDWLSRFPVIVRKGVNQFNKDIIYYLNYSDTVQFAKCPCGNWNELINNETKRQGEQITLNAWGVAILESQDHS